MALERAKHTFSARFLADRSALVAAGDWSAEHLGEPLPQAVHGRALKRGEFFSDAGGSYISPWFEVSEPLTLSFLLALPGPG